MFRPKWRVVHRYSVTDFTVLANEYWLHSSAARDARALNAARDDSFTATMKRFLTGSDTYIVASVKEVVAMELERARLRELAMHEKAEAADRLRREARSGRLSDGVYLEAEVPRLASLPHEPWRGRRGRPIERERDESSADGGVGICREPRATTPPLEHLVGRDLSGDVPTQGTPSTDQQCDGGSPAGDAGSSDCGSGGSYSAD